MKLLPIAFSRRFRTSTTAAADWSEGRVVVDSTWHHWFNMNVVGLEAEGGEDWDKVARYFVNVAKWIAPKGVYRSVCWWDIIFAHLCIILICHRCSLRAGPILAHLGRKTKSRVLRT